MSYCLNPNCQKASSNPDKTQFCQNCGDKLLLKERYRAIKPIGQGGFGRTFLAVDEDKPSKPRCVIKQFFPQAQGTNNSQKAAELFEEEAVRLDDLGKHPQIPELLANFTQDERQYLVQEFIDGQNLAQALATEGSFNETQIRSLLSSLLPVLDFIHSHNIIHRDIKPENLIRRHDGQLFIVDLGAAKFATGTALARTGTVIGSAAYAAPEQAMGKAIFASDIYSLGVTCIYLLTQIDPFDLYSTSEGAWVWRDFLSSPVDDSVAKILDKMLESATRRRYQSATEVLKDLNPQMKQSTTAASTTPAKPATPSLSAATALETSRSKPSLQTWKCVKTFTGHSGLLAGVRSYVKTFTGHSGLSAEVRSVAFSPDSQLIASGSEDSTIKIWNLSTGKEICTLSGHSDVVRSVTFSPDGQTLASGSDDKTIKLWNVETGKEICNWSGHSKEVTTVCISPDGQTLASGSDDKTVKVWNLKTGKKKLIITKDLVYFKSFAFSPDGQIIAIGCDNWIILWSLSKQDETRIIVPSPPLKDLTAVTFSPDGQTLASSNNNTIQLRQLSTTKLLRIISVYSDQINRVQSIAISPDGHILASGGSDKTIKLWNLETGELLCTLNAHSRGVNSVVFSPDGQTLASGSDDKTIKLWRCD